MIRAVLLLALAVGPTVGEEGKPILVFAAASLTEVLPQVGERFTADSGVPVRYSFAGSSTLARQIEQGAAADVFVSADVDWVAYLEAKRLLDPDSRRVFATNRLVAITPADADVTVEALTDLPARFRGRLAIADPAHVPAGRYAMQALTALGVWDALAGRLAVAGDVRGALTYVERGACDLGVVYATDARMSRRVRTVAVFPDSLHDPIRYVAGAATDARPGASAFVVLLARSVPDILREAGFTPTEDSRE